MLLMSRRKWFVPTLLVLLAISFFWRWQGATPNRPDSIPRGDYAYTVNYAEYRINQLMKQHHLPSVAVVLVDDQKVVWQEAFGVENVEKGVPATTDTIYKLWSISKVFTAIETMRLVEEGRIDLDAPITDYLPDFSIQSRFPDSEPITIRSILSHRSGLPRNECHRVEYRPGDPNVLDELVASLTDGYMAFPVGDRFKYSNIGPDALGCIIQQMRGEPFARYMKENLLAPVGMERSAFESVALPAQNEVALGYEYWKGDHYPRVQGDIASLPSGNLYSTTRDLANFVRFIFRDGEAGGAQLIKPETLKLMYEDQFPDRRDPQPMGLGWKIARVLGSERLVWHDGGPVEGIGSLIALLPERKLGVVLIVNEVSFDGGSSVPLALELLERMLETKYGVVPPESDAPDPVGVERALLEGYAGRYIAWGQVMDISLSGDGLKGEIQGMKFRLVPVGHGKFKVGHWLLELGLDRFLQLPIDLRELELEFFVGNGADENLMMINIAGISYETCLQYPDIKDVPALWSKLISEYELVYRLPSGMVGSEIVGQSEIRIEDGVLTMAGFVGPLKPISETDLIILSGPFAGETMGYDPGTGYIYHQSIVFKPITGNEGS